MCQKHLFFFLFVSVCLSPVRPQTAQLLTQALESLTQAEATLMRAELTAKTLLTQSTTLQTLLQKQAEERKGERAALQQKLQQSETAAQASKSSSEKASALYEAVKITYESTLKKLTKAEEDLSKEQILRNLYQRLFLIAAGLFVLVCIILFVVAKIKIKLPF